MANTFSEKAVLFLDILDEIYKVASTTSILDSSNVHFVDTKTIKLPKIDMDGLADYDRGTGAVAGDINVSYSLHELQYDRGRKFNVDVLDDDEAAFDVYRSLLTEFVRTKEVPEVDAIRYSEIHAKALAGAGTIVSLDAIANALELYDTAEQTLNDAEVPREGRILFASHAYYNALKRDPEMQRRIDVQTNNGSIDRRVELLDGVTPIMQVPKTRFYDVIQLLDGTTGGQEAGGFAPISLTSREINFIYADKVALMGIMKRRVNKIISPEVNQTIDGWTTHYRNHHDLIVPENKTAGIYIHKKATAVA